MLLKFKKKKKIKYLPVLIFYRFLTNSEKFQENFEEVLGKFGRVFEKF